MNIQFQSNSKNIKTAYLLISRLEHLSVDSIWARRSSGLRGSLLKTLEKIEQSNEIDNSEWTHLDILIHKGFEILENAAREIPDTRIS